MADNENVNNDGEDQNDTPQAAGSTRGRRSAKAVATLRRAPAEGNVVTAVAAKGKVTYGNRPPKKQRGE